jgi:hypothetical protein
MTALVSLENGWSVWAKMSARYRLCILCGAFIVMTLTTPIVAPALAASSDSDARDFFAKFVAAQNAHDIPAVEALLWDSPRMLWFTRGVEVRGAKAIAETLMDYYAGTWHLEPDMSRFQSTAIADDVVQILVPITFTRGLPGKPAQDNTFLISQTLVRGAAGWRVAAILPIANTKIK